MSQKLRQRLLLQGGLDALSVAGAQPEPNTGVTLMDDAALAVRKMHLYLDGVTLSVDEGDDYGSFKIADLPDKNLQLVACEVDLELVKGEVTNGLEAATDLDMAVGTAAASNATLSGAMVNVIEKDDLNAADASPAWQAHSADNASSVLPIHLADGASNALYLNCAASITASDALTVTGSVYLYYIDTGNETS